MPTHLNWGDPWCAQIARVIEPDNRSVTVQSLKKVEIDLFLLNLRREYKIYFGTYPFC
ncbi:hypothetical protein AE1304_06070 [Aeromonas enteropelogenes]